MPANKINFQTAKTQKFRATSLCQEDDRTISHIEEFGCSVVNVAQTNHGLGWSYTIGIFDTSGKPEVITVGLPPETAHFALNESAKMLRAGVDLTKGRHRDLIGEVECEFRPVDLKWIKHLWAGRSGTTMSTPFQYCKLFIPTGRIGSPKTEGLTGRLSNR
jgi:Domain of unknown function (DUF4262)